MLRGEELQKNGILNNNKEWKRAVEEELWDYRHCSLEIRCGVYRGRILWRWRGNEGVWEERQIRRRWIAELTSCLLRSAEQYSQVGLRCGQLVPLEQELQWCVKPGCEAAVRSWRMSSAVPAALALRGPSQGRLWGGFLLYTLQIWGGLFWSEADEREMCVNIQLAKGRSEDRRDLSVFAAWIMLFTGSWLEISDELA